MPKKNGLKFNILMELFYLVVSRIYIPMYAVILIVWNMQFGYQVFGELAAAASLGLLPALLFGHSMRQALVAGITNRRKRVLHGESRGLLFIAGGFSLTVSLIFALIFFLWGDDLIHRIFHRGQGRISVMLMVLLSLILMFSGCLEGFFKAYGVKGVSERGRILKTVIIFIASCVAGNMLYSYGERVAALKRDAEIASFYASLGIILGIILGSLIVLFYYYIFYRILLSANASMFRIRNGYSAMSLSLFKEIFSGVPMSLGRYGVFLADFALISLLAGRTVVPDLGRWISLGLIPVFTVMSILRFLWPDHMGSAVYSYMHQEYDTLADRMGGTLHSIVAVTIPVMAVLMVLSEEIITAFRLSDSAAGAGILRVSMFLLTGGMALQGAFRFFLGTRQKRPLNMTFFVWLMQIVFALAISKNKPENPEYGLAYGMVVYVYILGILLWVWIYRSYRIHTDFIALWGMPVVGGLVAGFLCFIIKTVAGNFLSGTALILLCSIPSLFAYFTGLLMLRGVRRGELKYFIFGGILQRYGELLGVYR